MPRKQKNPLDGPFVFEPHNGYGTPDFDGGEPWPYGYISCESPRVPIFELSTPLGFNKPGDPDKLRRMVEAMLRGLNAKATAP